MSSFRPDARRIWRHLIHAAGFTTARCTVCGAVCETACSGATDDTVHIPLPNSILNASGQQAVAPPLSTSAEISATVALPCVRRVHTAVPPLCPTCAIALRPRSGGFCSRCGMIFADEALPEAPCASCLTTPPPWDSLSFVASYTGLMRRSILRFKFHNALELGALLGSMLAAKSLEHVHTVDVVIPIPLHTKRLHERGYNQTLEIARPLAATLNAELRPALLKRSVATPHQTGLSKKQRSENLRNAFTVPKPDMLAGKRVLLVDDIMTTGATITAATKALQQAGTAAVHIAVVARTPDAAGR